MMNKFKQDISFTLGRDMSIHFQSNYHNDFKITELLNDGSEIGVNCHYDYDKDIFMEVYTKFLNTLQNSQEALNLSTFSVITDQSAIIAVLLFISEFLKNEMERRGDK